MLSIGIVLSSLGFLLYTGLNANMVYYFHVDEYIQKATSLQGETVKVNGKVVEGTIAKKQMNYRFTISGVQQENRINVEYNGVVPDTFKDGSDVVVEGQYDSKAQVFRASTLLAKCPTKYEPNQQNQQSETKKS